MQNRPLLAAAVAVLTGLNILVSAQQQPPAAPLIREGATVKLRDHVWAIPDFNVAGVPNVGIVVGNRATLIIDTGLGPRNGETIVNEMNKVSRNREIYVAFTHFHPEHSLGTAAFRDAKIVMPRIQQQEMQEQGKTMLDTFASRSPAWAELLAGVQYPKADMLIDIEHRWHFLDLGGVRVRMFTGATPLHTRGDTMFWVEEDRVLFSGDLVMSRRFLAANPQASISQWLATLSEAAALEPLHVVPAHGDLGNASLIDKGRQYLQTVQTRVGELKKQGKSEQEAVGVVAAEIAPTYPEWGNPAGSAATARTAFAEAR
jgi:glyoxylase-like metal-dependent hydrolase (beta-lactamase superfamily II)